MMENENSKHQHVYVQYMPEKALFPHSLGGTYLTVVDLKNPYQSNPIIDSSRQKVQRSRGRKKRACEYRTICPSPRAPQIAQLTDKTWTLATLLQSSDPTVLRQTCRLYLLSEELPERAEIKCLKQISHHVTSSQY